MRLLSITLCTLTYVCKYTYSFGYAIYRDYYGRSLPATMYVYFMFPGRLVHPGHTFGEYLTSISKSLHHDDKHVPQFSTKSGSYSQPPNHALHAGVRINTCMLENVMTATSDAVNDAKF